MLSPLTIFTRSGVAVSKSAIPSNSSNESFEFIDEAPQSEDPFLTILKSRTSTPRHSSCMCALCVHKRRKEEELEEFSRSFQRSPSPASDSIDSGYGSTEENGKVKARRDGKSNAFLEESRMFVRDVVTSGLKVGDRTVATVALVGKVALIGRS